MANTRLTKREAERFFGLSGEYNERDLSREYRKKVSMYHPDLAAARGIDSDTAEELMVTTNAANELLRRILSDSPSGSVVCEVSSEQNAAAKPTAEEKQSSSNTNSSYASGNTSGGTESSGSQKYNNTEWKTQSSGEQEQEDDDILFGMPAKKYVRHEVPIGQYVDDNGKTKTVYKNEYRLEEYTPSSAERFLNEFFGGVGYGDTPREQFRKSGPMPEHLRKKYEKVTYAHYRLIFAAFNGVVGLVLYWIWTYHPELESQNLALFTAAVAMVAVADLITGFITRPFRRARFRSLDRQLVRWRKKHPGG